MVNRKKFVDPQVKRVLTAFGAEIRIVMTQKGATFRWLEDAARTRHGVPLPKASVSRLLNGANAPNWPTVEHILDLCDVPRDEIEAHWKPRWRDVIRLTRTLGVATDMTPSTPTTHECLRCGGAIVNQDRHDRWHAEMEANTF